MMVRAHHFCIHLSLPIDRFLLWAGTISIPRTIDSITGRRALFLADPVDAFDTH
jgi:hypothetical protein